MVAYLIFDDQLRDTKTVQYFKEPDEQGGEGYYAEICRAEIPGQHDERDVVDGGVSNLLRQRPADAPRKGCPFFLIFCVGAVAVGPRACTAALLRSIHTHIHIRTHIWSHGHSPFLF